MGIRTGDCTCTRMKLQPDVVTSMVAPAIPAELVEHVIITGADGKIDPDHDDEAERRVRA